MFPYEIEPLSSEINEELMDSFRGERTGFCQVGNKKWILPLKYRDHAEEIYNMPLREDDVWIITYPRSGTTWTQEMIWLLNNNLDYETSKKTPIAKRFPFLEFNIMFCDKFVEDILDLNEGQEDVKGVITSLITPGYDILLNTESPRHIKSHLPFDLLPTTLVDTCKVVYVARNPKDVAPSFYHHNILFEAHGYKGDFEKYWDYFERNLLIYSPYWEHIKEGLERRSHPNVLLLFYEEMIKDLPHSIRRISTFLGKPIDEDKIEELVEHLHIDNFRKNVPIVSDVHIKGFINSSAQGFIRKGKVGGNKEEYTHELNERADIWIKDNLKAIDLKFPM